MLQLSRIQFGWKPQPYNWHRRILANYVSAEDRRLAQTIQEKDWGLTPAQILNQGNTGHCVWFGWATWGNCPEVVDNYLNADGHAIYLWTIPARGKAPSGHPTELRSRGKWHE